MDCEYFSLGCDWSIAGLFCCLPGTDIEPEIGVAISADVHSGRALAFGHRAVFESNSFIDSVGKCTKYGQLKVK